MQRQPSLADLRLTGAWLTIGVYDGVHTGHRHLLSRLVAGAHRAGLPAVVLTFDPHPLAVLRPGFPLRMLSSIDERVTHMTALGVDHVVVEPFDLALSHQSARDFTARLSDRLGFSRLLAGHDFAMGRGREGDVPRLIELGKEMGFEVEVVSPVTNGEAPISSSRIRAALAEGDVALAGDLLGRHYTLTGRVEQGAQRGRTIGIPTANLAVPAGRAIPLTGVYACTADVGGQRYAAAVNIGVRPTFEPETAAEKVEAHLLDFDRDIYNEDVTLGFLARLRGEVRFDGVDALIAQIHSDIEQTREVAHENLS